jgi:hypothetical protein
MLRPGKETTLTINPISGLGPLIREARSLIKGSKGTYFLLMLALLLPAFILSLVFTYTLGGGRYPTLLDDAVSYALGALATAMVGPGLAIASLRRAQGKPIGFHLIKENQQYFTEFLTLGVVLAILWFFSSSVFLYWVDVYVTVLIGFFGMLAPFFIVDRNATALEALKASVQVVTSNLGILVLLELLIICIAVLGILTLGILYIWFIPFTYIITALVYRDTVGIRGA